MAVYSTYDAKAKLSEILRRVRSGQRVAISYRGSVIAEISPAQAPADSLDERLKRLLAEGAVVPARTPRGRFPRIARRPGALGRFLESRE